MPKSGEDKVEFIGVFHGFTNSTFSRMFVEHLSSNHKTSISIPAMIEVNDPELIKKVKKIKKGQILNMEIKRKVGSTGHDLAAELCKFKVKK